MPIAKRLGRISGDVLAPVRGCGSAIFAALFLTPDKVPIGIGFAGVALAFGLTVLTGSTRSGRFPAVTSIRR